MSFTPITNIVQPSCDNCGLKGPEKSWKQIWGQGPKGKLMVIGEAPGAEENLKGVPFVGFSGTLLRQMLQAAGFDDDDVYFTNVCMCKPPGNRTPTSSEISACKGRLMSEIEYVNPTKILALGSTASDVLLGKSIFKCQGIYHKVNGYTVLPAFHPAYILRQPDAFRDLAFAIEKLRVDPCDYYPLEADGYPNLPYSLSSDIGSTMSWLETIGDEKVTVDIEVGDKVTGHHLLAVGVQTDEARMIFPGDHFNYPMVVEVFNEMLKRASLGSQNGGYEHQQFLQRFGLDFPIDFDTMLAHYALDERAGDDDSGGKGGSYHGLGTIAGLYLDAPDWKGLMAPYKEDYGLAPLDVLYRYLALDLDTEHRLRKVFEPMLEAESLTGPVNDLYFTSARTLARIELNGISIDEEHFKQLAIDWKTEIDADVEKFREIAGEPTLNLQSPKQVSALLFEKWKMRRIDGNSTDKKVIEQLVRKYPKQEGIKMIADIRSKKTILSTFILGIPKLVNPVTGKVHTRFLFHGTPTGRLASRDPNLQNIPTRIGPVIRDGFISDPGWDLLNIDYKQLEFRILGFYSGDVNLIEFIKSGRDIHTEVAREFFNLGPTEEPNKVQRLDAKTFVFGIPYGRGPESIAADFDLPLVEARRRYGVLKGMFPRAFEWIDEQHRKALEEGYVSTYTGRKRRFPLVLKQNKNEILRQAGNAPIQGLASDICLMAATRILAKANPELLKIHILVHDSILMSVREGHLEEQARWVIEEMEKDPFPTPIPFNVDAEYGKRWGSLQKLELPVLTSV